MKIRLFCFLLFTFCNQIIFANSSDDKEKASSIIKFSWNNDGERIACSGNGKNYLCYDFFHIYNKRLTHDDVERCAVEDLKRHYYELLRSVGLTMSEAREKVDSVIFDD